MEIPSLCSLICFAGCLRVGGSVGFLVLDELVDDLSDPRTGSESDAWGYRGEVFESQFHHRIHPELRKLGRGKKPQKTAYARLLAKATHALAEGESKPEPKDLWVEPYVRASSWTPCSHKRDWKPSEGQNGYIMITANGGVNQQRVAICNAVVVARLLNATLVLPRFMFSIVWRDTSQFGDIYQEGFFISYLKSDIRVVRELPMELQSLDLEAIGSMVTDTDIMKEAKPSFYLNYILPILHLNRVVHFVGFGNRLASDPIPHQLQVILSL
ncbi:hypothetical protein ACS0TY_036854 [Phlomoides rotata]